MGYILGISGNHGSGKSEVSKVLSKAFNFDYVTFDVGLYSYVTDIHSNPHRWAFEAQIAFLSSKISHITKLLELGRNIILDRTFYEDIAVFCKHFFSNGHLDARSYNTYLEVARLLVRNIPKPMFIIYCSCPPEICFKRIKKRGLREHEKTYSELHLVAIEKGLANWLHTFNEAPVFFLNTVQNNILLTSIRNKLINDIRLIFQQRIHPSFEIQLSMFERPHQIQLEKELKSLTMQNSYENDYIKSIGITRGSSLKMPINPFVYIAAPFTAEKNKVIDHYSLFPEMKNSVIENSYMFFLLEVEKCFKSYNLKTILPHRDNSKWGNRELNAAQLLDWCTIQVRECSLFVAIPSTSSGVHYELGLAKAWRKPLIVFEKEDKSDSKMSRGLQNQIDVLKLSYKEPSEIIPLLLSKTVGSFIHSLGLT